MGEAEFHRNPNFTYFLSSILAEAEVIGFLGFGYNPTVLERLGVAEKQAKKRVEAFGSAFGLPQGRKQQVETDFSAKLGDAQEDVLKFLLKSPLLFQGKAKR